MGNVCSDPLKGQATLQRTLSPVKHGHFIPSRFGCIPWGFHNSVLRSIKVAEVEKGRAPHIIEVCQVHKRLSYFPTIGGLVIYAIMDLWRDDQILADKELSRVSLDY